jgi:Tol biopolymer transport system component
MKICAALYFSKEEHVESKSLNTFYRCPGSCWLEAELLLALTNLSLFIEREIAMLQHFPRVRLGRIMRLWLLCITCVSCSTFWSSSNLKLFSQDGNEHHGGKWSPNGQWLAASIFPENLLQLFSANGQAINILSGCDLPGLGRNFAWLPDGRISCFTGNTPTTRRLTIIELDQKGQTKKRIPITVPFTPGAYIYNLQWNPHHFWLATIADSIAGETSPLLYLTDLSGQNLIAPLSTTGGQLAWSPDGTTLALVQKNGDIVLLKVQQIAPGKLAVSTIRQLAAGTPADENVAWSPSGRWLVCRHRTYESEDYLFLLATGGSGKQVKLTSSITDGQLNFPAWSPDGKQLIVSRVADAALMSLDIAAVLKAKGVKP